MCSRVAPPQISMFKKKDGDVDEMLKDFVAKIEPKIF